MSTSIPESIQEVDAIGDYVFYNEYDCQVLSKYALLNVNTDKNFIIKYSV